MAESYEFFVEEAEFEIINSTNKMKIDRLEWNSYKI